MKIVVTGNIGSGKSTVVEMLRKALPHYEHFNFDTAVHALYSNPAFLAGVREQFGTTERKVISDIVFADPGKKHALEEFSTQFLYPALYNALADGDQFSRYDETRSGRKNIIVEFPLLFETGWCANEFDRVLVVTCDEQTQRARIHARDGSSVDKLEAQRGSQFSADVKAAFADVVIDTGRDREDVRVMVEDLAQDIRIKDLQQRARCYFSDRGIWSAIEKAYTEPHRRYHTLSHLAAMFVHLDKFQENVNFPHAMALAIWFHDFVYAVDTGGYAGNEWQSANRMFRLVRELNSYRLLSNELALAGELILATKGHALSSPYFAANAEARADGQLFLDIDLSILSASAKAVRAYDEGIRQEFSMYPDEVFAKERARILKQFLKRDRIYLSEAFAPYEAKARENLTMLIEHWSGAQSSQEVCA